MAKKQYPALYVKSVRGTNYKNSSVNPTLYFNIEIDEQKAKEDAQYLEYMQQMKKEVYDAITHKFLLSIPTLVTNDKLDFLIFKDNIDIPVVKQFCNAIIDELNYFTKTKHEAKYYVTETILLQMDKAPNPLRASKVGPKFTETDILKTECETLVGDGKEQDYGIITPFDTYVYLKEKAKQEHSDQDETIVEW